MADAQPEAPQQQQQRNTRVDDTLTALFESLLPFDASNSDTSALEYSQSIIGSAKSTVHAAAGTLPTDINQAQDLIKRKLLRENSSPEKAARFSNLYSRLLGIGVLNQKWSILYLLFKLSEEPPLHSPVRDEARFTRSPLEDVEQSRSTYVGRKYDYEDLDRRRSVPLNGVRDRDGSVDSEILPSARREKVMVENGGGQSTNREHRLHGPRKDSREAASHPKDAPTELDLLRDLPFNLQGVSSVNLEFTAVDAVRLPKSLPVPLLSLLYTLAEPCLLYKKLSEFANSPGNGLISQSLSAAISNELRSYLGLVSTLEGEIRRALTAIEKGEDERKAVRTAGVTLKRCVIWTRDATMGLRLMSLISEEARKKRGGQLVTLIHSLSSSHGDPFVGAFAERLLAHVARPFYDMLRHWIYDGELVDPYNEFFVVEEDPDAKADVDPRRVATSVWEDKYKLEDGMVPTIISAEFAKKVFLIGKSLNFIRHNCGDSDWVTQYSQTHSKPLDYANTANLFNSIDTAYQTTMSRLTHLMSTKFLLFTHLSAIKKYLLSSQGDFIELLVESLAPNLDRPAHSQYRHTLTSQLEHAIRHSNAQYDEPEVLRRLDARMLELGRGDTGWDCFTLEYKISPPCDVVITQWASTQYLKIFNLLLRIKRVEYSLNSTWRRAMTGARGVLSTVNKRLSSDWKRARCAVAEMVHFVNQLQYYILFEVIEASWTTLQASISKPNATLDDLIDAHTKYVKTITQKGLLGSSAEREEAFLVQLHHILRCMLGYRDAVDGLYSYSVAEFTKNQQFAAKIEQRTAAGKWGITEKDLHRDSRSSTPHMSSNSRTVDDSSDSPIQVPLNLPAGADDATLIASLRARLMQLSTEFKSRVSVLLYDLSHQPDVDMRFLGVVMNFNEVYKPVNRRRETARKEREREREREKRKSKEAGTANANANANANTVGNSSSSEGRLDGEGESRG